MRQASAQPLVHRSNTQPLMRSSTPTRSVSGSSVVCSAGCSVAAPPPPTCFEYRHFHSYARAAPKDVPLSFACPRSHALSRFITPKPGFQCDSCSTILSVGNVMFGCRQCDHDLCNKCFALQDQSKSDVGSAVGSVKMAPRMSDAGNAVSSVRIAPRIGDVSSVKLASRKTPTANSVHVPVERVRMQL